MKRKVCELCGQYESSDMLFGVSLCNRCRAMYTNAGQVFLAVQDQQFMQNATPQARSLFEDKIKGKEEAIKKQIETEQIHIQQQQQAAAAYQEQQRRYYEEQQKHQQELQERFKKEQADRDSFLRENGHEGYYEYRVLNIADERSGAVNTERLVTTLNEFGRQGWRLVCAYTNELGKNASSLGIAGVSFGVNSTMDQSILILERFIKFKQE